jgi:hypothetical protein
MKLKKKSLKYKLGAKLKMKYNEGGKVKKQSKSTQAAQDDKARRVEEGSVIRKKDYDLSTPAGQEAFKKDQATARANRRQQKADQLDATRAANATGDVEVKKAQKKDNKETNKDRAARTIEDAKKVSEADKKKDTESTTFVIGNGGIKVKKSTTTKKAQTTGAKAKEIKEKKKKAVVLGNRTKKKDLLNG